MHLLVLLAMLLPDGYVTDLDAALKGAGSRPVLLVVEADWCAPCNELQLGVFLGEDGPALLADAVGVIVDFETPAGRAVTERYNVIDLPTTLVLDPKGAELSRIAGYPGHREYVEAVRDALRGGSSLEAAQARAAKAAPDDPAQLDLAEALLARGRADEARAILAAFMERTDAHGVRATRVWGRWLLRVQRRAADAEAHFRAAVERLRGKPGEGGFVFWAAKAAAAQGKRDEALALFDAWAARAPGAPDPALFKADFMVHEGYDPVACDRAIRAAERGGKERAWLAWLLAQVRQRQGDCAGARAALEKARELEPGVAIYTAGTIRLEEACRGK